MPATMRVRILRSPPGPISCHMTGRSNGRRSSPERPLLPQSTVGRRGARGRRAAHAAPAGHELASELQLIRRRRHHAELVPRLVLDAASERSVASSTSVRRLSSSASAPRRPQCVHTVRQAHLCAPPVPHAEKPRSSAPPTSATGHPPHPAQASRGRAPGGSAPPPLDGGAQRHDQQPPGPSRRRARGRGALLPPPAAGARAASRCGPAGSPPSPRAAAPPATAATRRSRPSRVCGTYASRCDLPPSEMRSRPDGPRGRAARPPAGAHPAEPGPRRSPPCAEPERCGSRHGCGATTPRAARALHRRHQLAGGAERGDARASTMRRAMRRACGLLACSKETRQLRLRSVLQVSAVGPCEASKRMSSGSSPWR